jgi:hypothetical protein
MAIADGITEANSGLGMQRAYLTKPLTLIAEAVIRSI